MDLRIKNQVKKISAVWLILLAAGSAAFGVLPTAYVWAAESNYILLEPLPNIVAAGTNETNLNTYLPGIFKTGIIVAAILAVLVLAYAGIQYMTTDSIPLKGSARQRITDAVLGLLLALGAYMFLFTINPKLVDVLFNLPYLTGLDSAPLINPLTSLEQSLTAQANTKIEQLRILESVNPAYREYAALVDKERAGNPPLSEDELKRLNELKNSPLIMQTEVTRVTTSVQQAAASAYINIRESLCIDDEGKLKPMGCAVDLPGVKTTLTSFQGQLANYGTKLDTILNPDDSRDPEEVAISKAIALKGGTDTAARIAGIITCLENARARGVAYAYAYEGCINGT